MEVFFVSTPTYSGNYKANLESFPDEYALTIARACRGYPLQLVERDAYLLACLEFSRCQRVNRCDLIDHGADIATICHAGSK